MFVRLKPIFMGFILLMLQTFQARAQSSNLSAIEQELLVYRRCHFQLSGKVIGRQDPRATAIKNGELQGSEACLQLLDEGSLQANDRVAANSSEVAKNIIRKMERFHRTWFSSVTVDDIQSYNDEIGLATRDIYDSTEPSLALTYSLLKPNYNVKNLLLDNHGYKALRQDDPKVASRIGWQVNNPNRGVRGNNQDLARNNVNFSRPGATVLTENEASSVIVQSLPMIETGELYGITAANANVIAPSLHIEPLGRGANGFGHNVPGLNFSFNIFGHHGAGLVGSPIYLMMNWGHGFATDMNGTTKLPRRWSENTLKSLLCLELPALREEDLLSFLRQTSVTPFRAAISCIGCHATLDPMSMVLRNKLLVASDFRPIVNRTQPSAPALLITDYQVNQSSTYHWPSEPNEASASNFHRQEPKGLLYYRGFDGRLVNETVENLNQMGEKLSDQKEFYQCLSKRYVHYFTGYNVHLYDKSDTRNEYLNRGLTTKDVRLRAWVEGLATKLHKHQSLQRLLQDILTSDFYKQSAQGDIP